MYDNLLIDGQQRSLGDQCYLEDQFPVFGYPLVRVTLVGQKFFETGAHFHCYITERMGDWGPRSYYSSELQGGCVRESRESVMTRLRRSSCSSDGQVTQVPVGFMVDRPDMPDRGTGLRACLKAEGRGVLVAWKCENIRV